MSGPRSPVTSIGRMYGAPTLYLLWRVADSRLASRDEFPAGGVAPRLVAGRGGTLGCVYVRGSTGLTPVEPSKVGVRWITLMEWRELDKSRRCDSCSVIKTLAEFDWSWAGPQRFRIKVPGSTCTACRIQALRDGLSERFHSG